MFVVLFVWFVVDFVSLVVCVDIYIYIYIYVSYVSFDCVCGRSLTINLLRYCGDLFGFETLKLKI